MDGDPAASVRPARGPDIDAAAGVLARAFTDEPLMCWIYRDPRTRPRRLRALYTAVLRMHLGHGPCLVTEDDGQVSAVAMWESPGQRPIPVRTQARHLGAFLPMFGRELGALRRSLAAMSAMDRRQPAEPHYYLSYLGTDPRHQGGGRGGALLREGLHRCDGEEVAARLETSTLGNVGFYERFGFRVTGEFRIAHDGPRCWGMWRSPGRPPSAG